MTYVVREGRPAALDRYATGTILRMKSKFNQVKTKMSRVTKVLGFSVPPTVVREVESIAKKERRTKSELFREMVRVYQRFREQRDRDETRWVESLIQEAQAEQAKAPMTTAEMLAESERLTRYGMKQAAKRGIKTDVATANRIIHERRRARKTS